MPIWRPPASICTCRDGIWKRRSIRSSTCRFPACLRPTGSITVPDKNEPPRRGGGRHPPRAGKPLPGQVQGKFRVPATQSVPGHSTLPHGGVGRSCRCLPPMWIPGGHLLQLLPQPALPEVPDAVARTLARSPGTRTAAHQLLPCRVHRSPRTPCAGVDQPTSVLRSVVRRQRSDLVGSGGRPETSGRRHRPDQHSAYLGTELAAPPARSLCHPSRRAIAEPQVLGVPPVPFLLAGEGSQPCVSRQVLRWLEASVPTQTPVLRRPRILAG